jgi:hypothetical protein
MDEFKRRLTRDSMHKIAAMIQALESRKLFSAATTFSHVYTVGPGGKYAWIGAALKVAGAGDEVLVLPGTYHEALYLSRSGQAGKPITIAAKTPGTVVLNGAGLPYVINAGSAQYITLAGLIVDGCADPSATDPPAVSTNSHWLIQNTTVRHAAGTGLTVFGNSITIQNVTAEYCGRAGLSGSYCSNVLVQQSFTIGNNTAGNDPDNDGGAGKWFQTDHVTLDGVQSHDNTGPGIWFDYNNTNVIIQNCKSYSNHGLSHAWSGNGIRIEVSQGPFLIRNNAFWGNTGSNIDIGECRNVTVTGNWMQGNTLALKDWDRGAAYAIYNISITGNTFVNTQIYTEGGTWNSSSGTAKKIVINRSTYQGSINYLWGSRNYTSLSAIRNNLGFELQGVLQ